jgi:hypothetical protein
MLGEVKKTRHHRAVTGCAGPAQQPVKPARAARHHQLMSGGVTGGVTTGGVGVPVQPVLGVEGCEQLLRACLDEPQEPAPDTSRTSF